MNESDREEAIFASVLALPADQRAAHLKRVCAGDAGLRGRLEELLAAHQSGDNFMESPVMPSTEKTVRLTLPPAEKAGDRIGRYKLMEQIGEGGCGIVYVAEQEQPVRRRVALKVIKLGMDTKEVIARFEAERQALALMDHPNIAKVLDAGATETGRPFFVMELVRGIKITEYCDENKLSPTSRLELFVQVCRAIQHAHQKGVIHRDIKPSNILVTVNDGKPVPKVIDFGIAKATQGRLTDQTVYTAFEQFIGTPAYMSPEQAVMTSLDIDTRSDIYSLGVLLYELLTGRTPFDARELMQAGLDAMRQTIREKEPLRPSTKLNHLTGDELTTTAKRRGSDAPKLINLLRGDLDWIVMKALEKDRTRRYETANGLAMDIERHLRNEPVVARPPSKFYRFQKLARRNKLAFAAAAAIAIALLLGATVSTWQAVRATRAEAAARHERDAATNARRQAETMSRFLKIDFLQQATPDAEAPEEIRNAIAAMLKRASVKLDKDKEIAGLPELEAKLRLAFGSTYFKLSALDEAERDLRRAVNLRREALGPEHRDTLTAQEALAWFLVGGSRKFDEGEQLSRETWLGRKKVLGPDNPDTLDSMDTYGTALTSQQKFEEAEPIYRQCLAARERVLGLTNRDTLTTFGNLATMLQQRGDWAEAERGFREAIDRHKRLDLPNDPDSFAPRCNLALVEFLQGRVDEAITVLTEALSQARVSPGPEHWATLHLQQTLARVWSVAGQTDKAEALAQQTLEVLRHKMPRHEVTGRTMLVLGRVWVEQDKHDRAEPLLKDARTLFREEYKMRPDFAAQAANWLGAIQVARRNYAEAERLLLPGVESMLARTAGLSSAEQHTLLGHIVQLYEAWNKPDQAAEWRKKLETLDQSSVR